MSNVKLTTIDNPFNPFTQEEDWLAFDEEKGYHTRSLIARIAKSSYELSDEEEEAYRILAIDEIIEFDFRGIYKKVFED